MRMSKNIIYKVIIIIIFILVIIRTFVNANNDNVVEYDLKDIGMNIGIDKDLTEMVSAIKNNNEKIENLEGKEEYIKNYENAGILIDALDNLEGQPNNEIIVVKQTNSSYSIMEDFNKLTDDEKNSYLETFVNTIKEQAEETQFKITKTELVNTENGNSYMNIVSTAEMNGKNAEMSIYYTIMNGNLITISFRYYGQGEQLKKEYEHQTVEGIRFYNVQRPVYNTINETTKLALGITFMIMILIIFVVIIIRIKDRRLLNKNIKDIKFKQYSKFGGLILFFWSLCFYQILLRVIDIDAANKLENMQFYKNALNIQNTLLALIEMYQIYIIVRRKDDTPKKFIISNGVVMITGVVITLIRIIYAVVNPLEVYTSEYFKQEISMLLYSVVYPLICIIYFIFSKRVQVYYYLQEKEYKEIFKRFKKNY